MYEEVEVNAILRVFHEDVAALRRYLVEAELLCRQIVRSVPAESLISGEQPSIQYSQMYWRP